MPRGTLEFVDFIFDTLGLNERKGNEGYKEGINENGDEDDLSIMVYN